MPNRMAWVQIDLAAVNHNIKQIRGKIQNNAKLCAVIKADGYGHGAAAMAKTAVEAGADYLAVALLQEAVELRDAGFQEPILILGFTPLAQSNILVDRAITQTVYSFEAAAAISKAAARQHKIAKLHLKIDTGMCRIGVLPHEAGALAERIAKLPNVALEGMFSHFATADCADKTFAYEQLARFKQAVRAVEERKLSIPIKHLANSAAILEMPEAHFDMVRAGVILYGLWPSDEVEKSVSLKSAFRLKARLSHVKTVPAGQGVSYGHTFKTARDSVIATLPIGYADGYTRMLSGKAQVEIKGRRAPVVGTICMDQCMVDVTGIDGVQVGDEATLFGSETLPVDEIAAWLGTINYEIVCMVERRVPRIYV